MPVKKILTRHDPPHLQPVTEDRFLEIPCRKAGEHPIEGQYIQQIDAETFQYAGFLHGGGEAERFAAGA